MQPQLETMLKKLQRLPPERLTEVDDFIDFLNQRDSSSTLRRDIAQASEDAFSKVWDNEEDAIYDKL